MAPRKRGAQQSSGSTSLYKNVPQKMLLKMEKYLGKKDLSGESRMLDAYTCWETAMFFPFFVS